MSVNDNHDLKPLKWFLWVLSEFYLHWSFVCQSDHPLCHSVVLLCHSVVSFLCHSVHSDSWFLYCWKKGGKYKREIRLKNYFTLNVWSCKKSSCHVENNNHTKSKCTLFKVNKNTNYLRLTLTYFSLIKGITIYEIQSPRRNIHYPSLVAMQWHDIQLQVLRF